MKDEATPEQIAMAVRIADRAVENHAAAKGAHTWEIAREAALAAIIETQESIASWLEQYPSPLNDLDMAMRIREISAAIRAGKHYGKDPQ